MFAEVIIDLQNNQVNRSFDYQIPSFLLDVVEIGARVFVPFGKKKLLGFVVGIKESTDYDSSKIKDIIDVIDLIRPLNEEFVEIAKYMANRYYSFYSSCLITMLPAALKVKYSKNLIVKNYLALNPSLQKVFKDQKEIIVNDALNEYLGLIKEEISKGNIDVDVTFTKKNMDKSIKMVSIKDQSGVPTSKKGKELFNYLLEINDAIALDVIVNDLGFSKSIVSTLAKNGLVEIEEKEVYRSVGFSKLVKNKDVILSDEQNYAINEVKKSFDKNETFLLHGITGSGKTEVYLELLSHCLASGKEAILLVPEISLTPQMTSRIYARFNDNVAVLHSGLSIGEKYDEWKKVLKGDAKIVVGARSAIFAPFKNLGLVIIDEEHEQSYKQDNNPKYDAVEIAMIRSKNHKCPLLLGSATPRLTDYFKALNGDYQLLELRSRPNSINLPESKIVDMREELKSGNRMMFSTSLQEELKTCFNKHEQSILFLNRRGFSSFVMCRSCGETIKCQHCDISLTYHKTSNSLVCHQCGFKMMVPTTCPTCKSRYIKYVGTGTEKIEEEIEKIIPGARILRMDADTTTTKNAYSEIYEKFLKGEADVLIGTQMITKGLDFPNVTLVGVMNADLSLKYPSYDAYETTFDLIEQVSGRAGRSTKDSKVIIQTYNATNYAITFSALHDYKSFYDMEIKRRNLASYPPFSEIAEVMVSGFNCDNVYEEAKLIRNNLLKKSSSSKVFGPVQASIFKLNDQFRFVLTIKDVSMMVDECLNEISSRYQNNKSVYISISRK